MSDSLAIQSIVLLYSPFSSVLPLKRPRISTRAHREKLHNTDVENIQTKSACSPLRRCFPRNPGRSILLIPQNLFGLTIPRKGVRKFFVCVGYQKDFCVCRVSESRSKVPIPQFFMGMTLISLHFRPYTFISTLFPVCVTF